MSKNFASRNPVCSLCSQSIKYSRVFIPKCFGIFLVLQSYIWRFYFVNYALQLIQCQTPYNYRTTEARETLFYSCVNFLIFSNSCSSFSFVGFSSSWQRQKYSDSSQWHMHVWLRSVTKTTQVTPTVYYFLLNQFSTSFQGQTGCMIHNIIFHWVISNTTYKPSKLCDTLAHQDLPFVGVWSTIHLLTILYIYIQKWNNLVDLRC